MVGMAAHVSGLLRKLRRTAFAVLIAGLGLVPVAETAIAACYSRQAFESEQMLRLHSELMLIGLSCQVLNPGANLFSQYQQYTVSRNTMLRRHEDQLIRHFRTEGGNATKRFHSFRTQMANDVAMSLAHTGLGQFCHDRATLMDEAMKRNEAETLLFLARNGRFDLTSRPLCAGEEENVYAAYGAAPRSLQ